MCHHFLRLKWIANPNNTCCQRFVPLPPFLKLKNIFLQLINLVNDFSLCWIQELVYVIDQKLLFKQLVGNSPSIFSISATNSIDDSVFIVFSTLISHFSYWSLRLWLSVVILSHEVLHEQLCSLIFIIVLICRSTESVHEDEGNWMSDKVALVIQFEWLDAFACK